LKRVERGTAGRRSNGWIEVRALGSNSSEEMLDVITIQKIVCAIDLTDWFDEL
jgi:hypothetical protein